MSNLNTVPVVVSGIKLSGARFVRPEIKVKQEVEKVNAPDSIMVDVEGVQEKFITVAVAVKLMQDMGDSRIIANILYNRINSDQMMFVEYTPIEGKEGTKYISEVDVKELASYRIEQNQVNPRKPRTKKVHNGQEVVTVDADTEGEEVTA